MNLDWPLYEKEANTFLQLYFFCLGLNRIATQHKTKRLEKKFVWNKDEKPLSLASATVFVPFQKSPTRHPALILKNSYWLLHSIWNFVTYVRNDQRLVRKAQTFEISVIDENQRGNRSGIALYVDVALIGSTSQKRRTLHKQMFYTIWKIAINSLMQFMQRNLTDRKNIPQ